MYIMGCSSSRASAIRITNDYDGLRVTEIKEVDKDIRGDPDGQEIQVEIRHQSQSEFVKKYRQCQVTQSTYVSESTASLEQSLT
ncbi:hypothetical protein ACF0H5_020564 [Mactra antiquata]